MPEPEVNPERTLARAAKTLAALNQPFAVIGGLAVSARAEPRFTKDVDLAVIVRDDEKFTRLVFELRAAGFVPLPLDLTHPGDGRLSTVRLRLEHGEDILDLLAASSGIEREVVESAEELEIPEVGPVPVARVEDLVALKVLAGRKQDHEDLDRLLRVNPSLDVERVRGRLRLISQRGYDRGKDLQAMLDEVLSRTR